MPEPVTTAAPETNGAGSPGVKQTTANIVKGIQDKANGKAPDNSVDQGNKKAEGQQPPVDPNAGKKKYVVKDDSGTQKEIWLTPEQADAYVQKGISFEPKVSMLSHLKNEMGQFIQTLASDPMKILTDKRIGLTPEKVLEQIFKTDGISDQMKENVGKWYYENVIAPMKMTPEELKAREDAKWRAERERQDATAKDQAVREENRKKAELAGQQLIGFVREAMKESGLPDIDTPLGNAMARRTIELHRAARGAITPKDAIERVKGELKQIQTAWYSHLDGEQLVKELGEENAEKVKKYFLKIVKEAEKKMPEHKPASTRGNKGERTGVISPDDMAEYLAKLKEENKPTRFK